MRKLKLLMAACALMGATSASATVTLETDLTSQFNSLATTKWELSSGQVGWAAPQVTTNSGLKVAAWERYASSCNWDGDIMYTTVSGLTAGTYKIELYGAAAFTFDRGFGSIAFTGDFSVATSEKYKENDHIDENTGVKLYATTSEGTVEKEIPIYYAVNFNTSGIATVTLENVIVGTNGEIKIGLSKTSKSTNWHVVQLKGVTATVDGATTINNLKATANNLLNNDTYANVVGEERTNLAAAADATPTAETVEAYQSVISALNSAISAFQTVDVASYNALAAEKTKAIALGMEKSTVNGSTYIPTNAAEAAAKTQALMVAEYNYVTTNFANAVNLGTWSTVNAVDRSSQHWDGTSTSAYSEQNEGWGSDSWSCSYSQDLSLPAGKYVFKVAGRKSSDAAVLELTVKNGTTELGSVKDFPNGDTGYGINKKGITSFNAEDSEGFAKNPNHTEDDLEGCGWQWRYVAFELTDPATVNVAVSGKATAKHQWVGFCNATVQTDNADNVALMEALVALNSAKTAAASLTKNTTNVGEGVFQLNESTNNSLWSEYETAKSAVDNYSLTSSSTVSEVNGLLTNLNTAIANYQNQPLIAPDASKRYNLTIVEEGKAWNGNAVTFIAAGRTDQGNYGVKYLAPVNANLNQALKFTAVEGEANTYKISAIRVENGEEQYLTTGTTYEGNNDQIRTTDDADQAMKIKVEATATEGQFQLRNVAANKIIANNNNNDMYTNNSANFTIAEASEASVTVNIAEGVKYATAIFPFTPNLSDVTYYSCAAADGNTLTLVKVETPEANKPYILESTAAVNQTLEGWGTAPAVTCTVGWLTGVFANTDAPVGSYVLQDLNDVVGFYKVAEGENNQPTVNANHAYMTIPATEPEARALYFDNATAIKAIEALTSGESEIYDAAGVRQAGLQKGVNIVKKGGKSFKVMVK